MLYVDHFSFFRSLRRLKRNIPKSLECLQMFLVFSLIFSTIQAWAGNMALRFDGVDDRIVSPLGTGLYYLNDFTIEAWTNLSPDAGSGNYTIYGGGYHWHCVFLKLQNTNKTYFLYVDAHGGEHIINVETPDNRSVWVYWALVRDAGELRAYRNGVLIGKTDVPQDDSAWLCYSEGIWIGTNFKGAIDEVRISNIARPEGEISATWNNGSGKRFEADGNTVSLWHFDEGDGQIAYDFSPSKNDAVLGPDYPTNCPNWIEGFPFSERAEELSILHADFHGRLGLKIRVGIAGVDGTENLKVLLTSEQGYHQILHVKEAPLPPEVTFTMDLRTLPAGNYTVTYQLLNQDEKVITQVIENFSKTYDCIPIVGIDENNAICVNGEPFFPVTPWGLDKNMTDVWFKEKYINSLCGQGWSTEHSLRGWEDYLDYCRVRDFKVIGPGDEHIWGGPDINTLINYVNQTKKYPNLLMWMWDDEPDLIPDRPPTTVRGWTDKCHELDPQHLVTTNLAGFTFVEWVRRAMEFSYPHIVDVYSFDYYPIAFNGTFAKYVEIMDRVNHFTKGLVPYLSFVETCDLHPEDPYLAPTAQQLQMEIWLNIVHGVKGISWFHYFAPTPPENLAVMAKFLDHITKLTPIVLSPDPDRSIQDNANEPGNRVDTMIREYEGNTWVFAVRLTEVDEANNPPITVTFNVEGINNGVAHVFDEGRDINIKNGKFQDTFAPNDVHIYVSNRPPIANAGPNQTITDSDNDGSEQVTLDGSGSQDPDGTIISFVWTKGGLQIATGVKPTVTLSTGTHTITLTVTDNNWLTDTDTVTIIVSPFNQPPIANAGPDQVVIDEDRNGSEEVTLDGSVSTDPDGTIVSFVWNEDGLQIATGVNPTVVLSTGKHSITLTVTDNEGLTDTDTVTIIVSPFNQPPIADAGPDQTITDKDRDGNEDVTLDGSDSLDPNGIIVSFIWSEDGLQIATGVNPTVVLSTGTHSITLTVTDNDVLTDTDTVTITVREPISVEIRFDTDRISKVGTLHITGETREGAVIEEVKVINEKDKVLNIDTKGKVSINGEGDIAGEVVVKDIVEKYPLVSGIKIRVKVREGDETTEGETEVARIEPYAAGPDRIGVYNNVFNPLNGEKVIIKIDIAEQTHIKINLYDTKGKKIKELADEERDTGMPRYEWDGKDGSGNVVGSGLYFVHIQAGDYKKTKKIVVVK
jgi:hypothetical protein